MRKKLAEVAFLAALRSETLWAQNGRTVEDENRASFLEFSCKHFIRISYSIDRKLKEALVAFDIPDRPKNNEPAMWGKAIAFGLQVWEAETPENLANILKPLLEKDATQIPPNLKKAVIIACQKQFPAPCPVKTTEPNLTTDWPEIQKWLIHLGTKN